MQLLGLVRQHLEGRLAGTRAGWYRFEAKFLLLWETSVFTLKAFQLI